MSVYFDASLIVALFLPDPFNTRVRTFMTTQRPAATISDFAASEFASVVARRVRTGELTEARARTALAAFDAWTAQRGGRLECVPADIRTAESYVRRLDLPLRTPDAISIAIAARIGAPLATFDRQMADCAVRLGLGLASV